jgi:hypothetical protein
MYKFEISADSPEELNLKMQDFAKEVMRNGKQELIPRQPELPQYIDEAPELPTVAQYREKIYTQAQSEVTPPNPFAPPPSYWKVPEPQSPQWNVPAPAPTVEMPIVVNSQWKTEAPTFTPPPAVDPNVDASGALWNAAIHASTRNKTKDGMWKKKKVYTEKTAAAPQTMQPAPAQALHIPPPSMDIGIPSGPQVHVQFHPAPQAPVAPPVVQAPVQQVVPVQKYENVQVPAGTRPAHSLISFKNNLTLIIAQLITEKKIDQNYVQQMKNYFQVKEIWNILQSERQCIEMYDEFAKHGFITQVDG